MDIGSGHQTKKATDRSHREGVSVVHSFVGEAVTEAVTRLRTWGLEAAGAFWEALEARVGVRGKLKRHAWGVAAAPKQSRNP
ncbi:hypothetical protein EPI10_028058 [Gossypium australe]|uniref:Uncharacterized protein n=1 Tax=Gossypium australe TaxID=47621 RepID=A0A5B6UYL0_9ROSI|nr:hypothetical protein EPI10_028058 [Gossypium australe]